MSGHGPKMVDWRGMRVHIVTARHWERIEAEYGEPVADVIRGMRADGYLWSTIAGALEVTQHTLISWRAKLGIETGPRLRDAELAAPRPSDVVAQAHGYANLADAICSLRGVGWTLSQIAKELGLCLHTIWKHTPDEWRGVQIFTPEERARRAEHALRVFDGKRGRYRNGKEHPWRSDERDRYEAMQRERVAQDAPLFAEVR